MDASKDFNRSESSYIPEKSEGSDDSYDSEYFDYYERRQDFRAVSRSDSHAGRFNNQSVIMKWCQEKFESLTTPPGQKPTRCLECRIIDFLDTYKYKPYEATKLKEELLRLLGIQGSMLVPAKIS